MKKELNIAAILNDKPRKTKLWCSIYGKAYLKKVYSNGIINITHHGGYNVALTENGKSWNDGECVLFPSKSMRDWRKFAWKKGDVLEYTEGEEPYYAIFEAFQDNEYTSFKSRYNFGGGNHWLQFNSQSSTNHFTKVSDEEAKAFIEKVEEHYGGKLNLETLEIDKQKQEFKDGDIVTHEENNHIYILEKWDSIMDRIFYHASLDTHSSIGLDTYCGVHHLEYPVIRLATDSEKQQLFSALEKKGKRWNAETKTLVDLPKKREFKVMNWCLMRNIGDVWKLCQFGFIDDEEEDSIAYNAVGGNWFDECIPYNEETKHLLGTNDDWKGGEV